MPAASEPTRPPELPHTWRPLGPRVVGIALSGCLVVIVAAAWIGFDEETQAKFTPFQLGTLVFVGLLAATVMYALLRSRAVAERERLVVVNGYRRREFAWAQIVSVHLPPGAPWVTLDLTDGTTVSVMGIQASDGRRAQVAARQLRVLVEQIPG